MQLSMLSSFIIYQKNGGRKVFLGFQCEVIAVLSFENGNGVDIDIPREDNIMRLTEHHFVSPIPETGSKWKPQKRCRVCYKKGVRKDSRYHCAHVWPSPFKNGGMFNFTPKGARLSFISNPRSAISTSLLAQSLPRMPDFTVTSLSEIDPPSKVGAKFIAPSPLIPMRDFRVLWFLCIDRECKLLSLGVFGVFNINFCSINDTP